MTTNSFNKRIKMIILTIVVACGFVLRLIGYDWGGNSIYQADEGKLVFPVEIMAEKYTLISEDYYYPNQFLSKFDAAALMIHNALFADKSEDSLVPYWICRIITAVFGTATIIVVYFIGDKLEPGAGIIAGTLFALCPSMVLMSKQVTGDVGALFGASLTAFFALEYSRDTRLRYIVLMSMGAAIAMLEKWHGGGTTVFIALYILLFAKSVKDFVINGFVALISFIGWIFIIAPNVVLNAKDAIVYGFLNIATYDGHQGPDWHELFGMYMKWGFVNTGGVIYILAVIAGVIIVIQRRKKEYCVLLLGVIKTAELCFLNRAFPRWALELYLSELICISIFIHWAFTNRKWIVRTISAITMVVVSMECITASSCIDIVAIRKDQDIRYLQEIFCSKNDIIPDNTVSCCYSAFIPPGKRIGGLSERANNDLTNVFEYEDGKLVRTTDKRYFVWTGYGGGNEGIVECLDSMGLCIWSINSTYYDIFSNPLNSIEYSWNDFALIRNNIDAFVDIYEGALVGSTYDSIKIYDISGL